MDHLYARAIFKIFCLGSRRPWAWNVSDKNIPKIRAMELN